MKLPGSLDPNALRDREIPGDVPLAQVRTFLLTLPDMKGLAKVAGLQIQFWIGGQPAAEDMTLLDFRRRGGVLVVSSDEDDGGSNAMIRPLPLPV